MWGPYDRTAYDRGSSPGSLYNQTLTATYVIVADISSTFTYMVNLAATYIVRGYRMRMRAAKLLRATYEVRAKYVRRIGKNLAATFRYIGDITILKAFYRTLAATYEVRGSLTKRMYVRLLATTVWAASRLRAQRVYGWDYSGDFAPGDRIKVDRDRLTVTLNGSNIMHLVDGDLPFFQPGPNVLTYEDSEGARQVKIRVLWRGRWL